VIKVEVKNNIKQQVAARKKQLEKLQTDSQQEFVKLTPIDQGNARRRTKLQGKAIVADYPYAGRLDEGSSKQAPKGMTEPFIKWYEKQVAKIFGK
jgi:predicted secreted protein